MPRDSPISVTYRSGTSEGLGAGWDVMQVISKSKDLAILSSLLAMRAGPSYERLTVFLKNGKSCATKRCYELSSEPLTTETGWQQKRLPVRAVRTSLRSN